MGSFRSKAVRATDVAVLTIHDKPADVADDKWLGADESIRYLTKPTHRMSTRLADDGTVPVLDKKGRRVVDIRVKAGTMSQIKLEEGIVDWTMFDETGKAVPWDRARAAELVEGLPTVVRQMLIDRIAKGAGDDEAEDDDEFDPEANPEDRRGNE